MMTKRDLVQITSRSRITDGLHRTYVGMLTERLQARLIPQPIPIDELSDKRGENLIAGQDDPTPDCLTCGACCQYFQVVLVREGDPTPAKFYWEVCGDDVYGGGRSLVLKRDWATGSCVALEGEVGRQVRCTIYEQRPESCRWFEAGSDQCHAVRCAFGLEPPLAREVSIDRHST